MKILYLKIILINIVLTISLSSLKGLGFGEWNFATPYGSTLQNAAGNELRMKGNQLKGLRSWYFYKGRIIGQYTSYSGQRTKQEVSYFIATEKTGEIETFTERANWVNTLEKKKLHPMFTRWYQDHFTTGHFFIILFPLVPILIVTLVVTGFIALIKEQFDFSKKHTRIFFSVVGVLMLIAIKNIVLGVQSF